ncbi:hypothetical protein [Pseudoxanthomonas dokdonensis]|uniref:Uncharacterized protein n=1 Tax=Pseudoxanthomonas dokdonensis TaxID=344882 RepID=A0A0R0CEF4_9GAMM|nr:hypothetical protein [Pseudoxanthomonas dokdonensis]KRG68156.1 hypothetical protein ABB29_14000 [Pseudoxanthomonas dokdonensis]
MVYTKTDAGRDEIQQRSRKLPTGLRSILLMVDGQRNEAELKELASALKAPDDALEQLLAQQLIAVVDTATGPAEGPQADAEEVADDGEGQRRAALYNLMTDAIHAHLGLKGYFLQLKVERCTDMAALVALMPDISAALGKAKSDALAKRWLDNARSLLAETQAA